MVKKNNNYLIKKYYIIILIIFSFFCGLIFDFSYKSLNSLYEIDTIEINDNKPSLYIENQNEQIYLIGLKNVINNKKNLKESYEYNFINDLISENIKNKLFSLSSLYNL